MMASDNLDASGVSEVGRFESESEATLRYKARKCKLRVHYCNKF